MGNHFNKENNESAHDNELDLHILREDLAAELLAINQYQVHIEALTDEEAIKVLEHIREDNKQHVSELLKLIQRLDTA